MWLIILHFLNMFICVYYVRVRVFAGRWVSGFVFGCTWGKNVGLKKIFVLRNREYIKHFLVFL